MACEYVNYWEVKYSPDCDMKFIQLFRNIKVKDTYSLHMAPDSPLNAYSKEILTHVKDYK